MSKRKSDQATAGAAKRQRGGGAAAAAASSPSIEAPAPAAPTAAISHVQYIIQKVNASAKLSLMLRNPAHQSSVELMTALAVELQANSRREQSLIDLSQKLAGGGTLLTLLIEAVAEHTLPDDDASPSVNREKDHAEDIFYEQLHYVLTLVRAADASQLLSKDGESAVSLTCKLATPQGKGFWGYRIVEALLEAGADADARDKKGSTPLHEWTLNADESACGPLLLLRHGAHIDAQDSDGDSMLHMLVHSAVGNQQVMLPALRQLAASGYLALADFTLLNNAGDTALQMAREFLVEQPDDETALELLETLHAHSQLARARELQSATGASNAAGADVIANSLAFQRIKRSLRVFMLLRNVSKLGSVELMTEVTKTLAEDAKRPESLIDLNHTLAGGGTLLTLLIETLLENTLDQSAGTASDAELNEKKDACEIIRGQLPHLLTLVNSADADALSKDGETPLSLLCSKFVPSTEHGWIYCVAEALLQAGASVETRDRNGCTPLQAWTFNATSSACGPLLLLRHGASIDAQDRDDGDTALHMLVHSARENKEAMLPAFRELAASQYLVHTGVARLNHAGQTALQLAQALAEEQPTDAAALEVFEILFAQSLVWPQLRSDWGEEVYTHMRSKDQPHTDFKDLVPIIMTLIDGQVTRPSELPTAAVDEADAVEEAAAAAAPAAAVPAPIALAVEVVVAAPVAMDIDGADVPAAAAPAQA